MRASKVVPTDDEVRADMKAANASSADVRRAMEERQAQAAENQRAYDKATTPFAAGLQRQKQE